LTGQNNQSVSGERKLNNGITDEDIKWHEKQITFQTNSYYVKRCQIELKIAKAVQELQNTIQTSCKEGGESQ